MDNCHLEKNSAPQILPLATYSTSPTHIVIELLNIYIVRLVFEEIHILYLNVLFTIPL